MQTQRHSKHSEQQSHQQSSVAIQSLSICMLLVLLSGCAHKTSLQRLDPNKNIPLTQIEHWQLKARMAIRTAEDNVTASLNWQKDDRLFDFHISGAFGATYAHLIQLKNKATLKIPDTELLTHQNAQILLQNTLGWEFPIDALSYWVKGLPSNKPNEKVQRNSDGQIEQIQLNHWQIDFSSYQRFQGYQLPKKIKATHPQMTIKLVAKNWSFFE